MDASGLAREREVPNRIGRLLVAFCHSKATAQQDALCEVLRPLEAGLVDWIVEDVLGLQTVESILRAEQKSPARLQRLARSGMPLECALHAGEVKAGKVARLPRRSG